MKRLFYSFLLLVLFSFSCKTSFAQNKTVTDTASFRYYDYPNRKYTNATFNEISKQSNNTLIIINNKIYKASAKEFKELDKDKIAKMEVIKDEQSATEIKYVIIITTK